MLGPGSRRHYRLHALLAFFLTSAWLAALWLTREKMPAGLDGFSTEYSRLVWLVAAVSGALGITFYHRGRGHWAVAAFVAAAFFSLGAWRTVQIGRLPLTGRHGTLLTYAICLATVCAVSSSRKGLWRTYGLCLTGAALLLMFSSVAELRPAPMVPVLQTAWFEIHVAASFVAYACFALGAANAIALLVDPSCSGTSRSQMEAANRWGFAWFSWGMVTGGIWAYLAWGTYWLWGAKELWSAVVWIYYAAAVHLCHMPKWRGKRQAALSILGLAIVIFTYLGVSMLMQNTHKL